MNNFGMLLSAIRNNQYSKATEMVNNCEYTATELTAALVKSLKRGQNALCAAITDRVVMFDHQIIQKKRLISYAICRNNYKLLNGLIEKTNGIEFGVAEIINAIHSLECQSLKILMQNGAKFCDRESEDMALTEALRVDRADMFAILLQNSHSLIRSMFTIIYCGFDINYTEYLEISMRCIYNSGQDLRKALQMAVLNFESLMLAACKSLKGRQLQNVIALLAKYGADAGYCDLDGFSPLDYVDDPVLVSLIMAAKVEQALINLRNSINSAHFH